MVVLLSKGTGYILKVQPLSELIQSHQNRPGGKRYKKATRMKELMIVVSQLFIAKLLFIWLCICCFSSLGRTFTRLKVWRFPQGGSVIQNGLDPTPLHQSNPLLWTGPDKVSSRTGRHLSARTRWTLISTSLAFAWDLVGLHIQIYRWSVRLSINVADTMLRAQGNNKM